MTTLADLHAAGIGVELRGEPRTVVRGVHHDSRQLAPGDLFVAIVGQQSRGEDFARDAERRGAAAIATETWIEGVSIPQLKVANARRALALAADLVHGMPTALLCGIGVTGTNGKTTTTWILDEALTALGARPSLLGTVETRGPGLREPSAFTTPEGDAVARFAARMREGGATHLVMEVSSHALALHRADGVRFSVVAFTNLTQDHLDFHGSMEAYGEAKARLFGDAFGAPHRVVRIDDPFGAALAERLGSAAITVSRRQDATVRATNVSIDRSGVRADVRSPWGALRLESPLLGGHNLDNLLVAAACLLPLGHAPADVARALGQAVGAPGRLERVHDPRDVAVLVDYAHSPDALENVLGALRPLTPGRLLCVFGCGGDRDRTKRPRMGEAAGRHADVVIVTSDNPRTEDPGAIVDAVLPGLLAAGSTRLAPSELPAATRGHVVEVDRRSAIERALHAARPGDTVLIAGKGHEPYQILGHDRIAFDDRVEARRAIDAACAGAPS